MSQLLDTVLLLALPASGKSEVRNYLDKLDPELARRDFHMGETVQLDDYPYVHMIRRIDEELRKMGFNGVYFRAHEQPFVDPWDWGTLVQLVNADYEDLVAGRKVHAESAARWLFTRIDEAAVRASTVRKLASLPGDVLAALAEKLELEARDVLDEKNQNVPDSLEGKTIVIEFARGGRDGAAMPLEAPWGYRHSLSQLSSHILSRSVVLYVWVTPEESRRKNRARADPNDPGSILHHGTPEAVMYHDYGCDDMEDMLKADGDKGTIVIDKDAQIFRLNVSRFDNRQDKTSFLRDDKEDWSEADVKAIHGGLKAALDHLVS